MVTKIGSKTFSGSAKVFDGTLAAAVKGLAIQRALQLASGVADITDSSTGSAGASFAAVAALTPSAVSGTNAAQKAALETAYGTVRDGLKEIVAQVNLVRAKVPAFSALTDSMGGTAADGTIGAIGNALTGVSTSMAAAAGAQSVLDVLASRTSQAVYFVNELCYATGLTPLVDSSGSDKAFSTTFAAVSTDTGTAASGADTGANAIALVAEANARLGVLKDAIASMAAKLNAMTADANATAAATVIASR